MLENMVLDKCIGLLGWPLWLQWWSATLTKFFDFVSFNVSHVKVDFQKVLTASKITGKYTLRKIELIFISIHYWQRSWDEKGIKTSGRTHRIIIFRFPGWPRGFRAARCQKPLKKSQEVPKMTKFRMFFVSSSPKTTWLTWNHKN